MQRHSDRLSKQKTPNPDTVTFIQIVQVLKNPKPDTVTFRQIVQVLKTAVIMIRRHSDRLSKH